MVPPRPRPRPYASAIELGSIPAKGKITQDIAHLNVFAEPEYKSKSDPENTTQVQKTKIGHLSKSSYRSTNKAEIDSYSNKKCSKQLKTLRFKVLAFINK